MYTLLIKTMLIGTVIVSGLWGILPAQGAEAPSPGTGPDRPEPCYVVIAVDVSGGMESSDEPTSDFGGRRQTLRDEGQLIFLQMLPFLRSEMYVGVAHFSDRVRYGLPSAETGPLLPWGQTFLTESACRNLVRPAEFQATFHTDIAESMSWTLYRVAAARQKYGPGPAKLIVLTNGDPRDSAREMERGGGPLLSMAKRFAELKIQVYPVLINGASFRSTAGQPRLSADEIAAEDLMNSVALMTGGKAYRLTREFGFADILMDAFDLGMRVRDDLLVSRHDWAIVTVGEPLRAATMEPAGPDKGLRSLTMDSNMEAMSGIRSNVIASPWYQTTILRRPESPDLVDRFWQGKWRLGAAEEKQPPAVRVYRIPDFLIQLELKPDLPWWLHEQVQVKARLLDRHRRGPGSGPAASAAGGKELSIRIRAASADQTNSVLVDRGLWTAPARLYETEPFAIGTPGLYKLGCELRHAIGDVNVPILQSTSDVYVHSECVSIKVVNAATDEVLGEVPPAAGATLNIDLQGGQDVYLRVSSKGEFKVEPLPGVLHLEPSSQTDWPLRQDEQGNLLAGPIRLVEQEERLIGSAELEVRTHVGVRRIRLPRFELAYPPAPMRIECRFTDLRRGAVGGRVPQAAAGHHGVSGLQPVAGRDLAPIPGGVAADANPDRRHAVRHHAGDRAPEPFARGSARRGVRRQDHQRHIFRGIRDSHPAGGEMRDRSGPGDGESPGGRADLRHRRSGGAGAFPVGRDPAGASRDAAGGGFGDPVLRRADSVPRRVAGGPEPLGGSLRVSADGLERARVRGPAHDGRGEQGGLGAGGDGSDPGTERPGLRACDHAAFRRGSGLAGQAQGRPVPRAGPPGRPGGSQSGRRRPDGHRGPCVGACRNPLAGGVRRLYRHGPAA